jgi:hypothetical protein
MLSTFDPAEATTYVAAPRRNARTSPAASIEIREGSRGVSVGFGVATLPNASRLSAVIRVVSAAGSNRALCGLSEMLVIGPAVPVAENFTVVPTPETVAVTSLGPTIVPSVQVAVAWPLASLVARRGEVEPLPNVTASATVAP